MSQTSPSSVQPVAARDLKDREIIERFSREWIAPRWKQIAISVLVAFALGAATSGYPAVMKYAFDTLGQGNFNKLWIVLGAIVAITAARGLFLYLHQIISNTLVMGLGAELQRKVFRHVINADYAQLTKEKPGQTVSRLTNDIGFILSSCQHALNTVMRDLITVIGLVGFMLWTDWLMSLIVMVVYPLAIFPIVAISRRLRRTARQTQHELGDMTGQLAEKIGGARLIKTFRLEDYAVGQLDKTFTQVLALRLKAVRQKARLGPILEALAGIAIAGVIGLASWRISTGIATTGDFMAFVTCLLLAANSLRSMSGLATALQEGIAGAERVYEVIDAVPTVVDRRGAKPLTITQGQIAFDAVSFAYASNADAPAVTDVSLIVPGGKTVAFVGRSGAGKSTLINLVPRLFDVSSGAILIDRQDVRDVTLASLRDQIAIVSQDVTLFDDSIRANIALGRLGATEAEIIAAAKAAAAHDFIMAQPQGYDTVIGDAGSRLSGGQKQRLALARAIVKDAPILLLDEATSALDTESERLVQDALARFTRNRTTLVIAHRLSTVQRADLICVMEGGQCVEQGSHAELLASNGRYAALCRSQLLEDAGEPDAATLLN